MDRNATDIVPKCAEFCSFSKNIHFVEGLCMKSRENQFFSAPEHFSKMRLGFSCQWHSSYTFNAAGYTKKELWCNAPKFGL